MKCFIFFILLLLNFNSLILSSSFNYAATGGLWTIACGDFCFYPAPNDTSYTRGKGLCLWANIYLSQDDVGKVFYQKVKNSSGEVIEQKLLKILQDDFCYDGNQPSGFPNGYALYYYSLENKKYLFDYCVEKNEDSSYDLKQSFAPAGCGKTDCSTRLGKYTYEFYEEGAYKGNATFWIVPDFIYYDKFNFGIKGNRFPAYCDRGKIFEPNTSLYGSFRCNDW